METVKQLMRSGDVRGAAERLKAILAVQPDDAEAQMLFGTCCHLLGDDDMFKKIHDDLAPKMETVADARTQSLWRKYHAIWMSLIVGGLVLAGLAAGVAYLGRTTALYAAPADRALSLYAGPEYYRQWERTVDPTIRPNKTFSDVK